MPEDQGVNGDIWTEQAGALLDRFGWTKVAASNIDVPGSDGLMHGIDSMFIYHNEYGDNEQAVFLEAKSYVTSSSWASKIPDWVDKLNQKIQELKRSESFYADYPPMRKALAQNGVLLIWFRDHSNFMQVKPKLDAVMLGTKVPRGKTGNVNRLFVMSNDRILRLASIFETADYDGADLMMGMMG